MRDFKAEQASREAKDQKILNKLKLPTLEGFTESTQKAEWGEGVYRVLSNEELKVKFIYRLSGSGRTEYWYEPVGKKGWWASFDRTGVEDSFYWDESGNKIKTSDEMLKIFNEHLKRIKKSREYAKSAISVPNIGFSVSPEGKLQRIKQLKDAGWTSFHPSGFGTGYTISRMKQRYSNPATPEMIEFWGVGQLYISTMDCD